MEPQTVEVQSAAKSKINWVAAVTVTMGLLTAFGLPLSEEQRIATLAFIVTVGPIAIMYLRIFWTKTITPAAAKKMQ